MASLERIKSVIKKIISVDGIGNHVCFFGGSIPYLYYGKDSKRDHSDIDVLVEEGYINIIRDLVRQNNLYKPELDSGNFGLDDDYGLKVFIDGVYVEFEPMVIRDGVFVRKSFNPDKEVAGTEVIPYLQLEDLIVKVSIDGIFTFCQSMEMIKVGKEQYKRDKDLKDIKFIDEQGIDQEKYKRAKESLKMSSTSISSYDELRRKKNK
ncbi:MAG: hypothetical protein IJ475_02590 [Bacilli bacterium]|nr:hypothetical protein [Bacilli bacterium]